MHRTLSLITAAAIWAAAALPAGGPPIMTLAPVRLLSDNSIVAGASSMLVRNDAGLTMNFNTTGLLPGTYTIWWVIYNDPSKCDTSPCNLDIFDDDYVEANGSTLWAAGHIVTQPGQNFSGWLGVGDTKKALDGPGLLDPRGAEIYLIARYHGPLAPKLVHEQISTFGGGCSPATGGSTPGGFDCYELQYADHIAP